MRSDEEAIVPSPVPPLVAPKSPVTSVARFTALAEMAPAVALRTPERFPILSDPKNPLVDEAYVAERLVVEALPKVCVAVKVFAVYVFGMVVEALMYEFTPSVKFETCEFVMERLLSVVMEFTEDVAARLPMNDVVARAVVKYKLFPSSMSEVVVEYQFASVRYCARSLAEARPRDDVLI